MPTDQKAASAVVTSAMRDIARGFQLVLGLALYLLGPVGILFGMPLIVTAFAPSKVKKVVAIVYFYLGPCCGGSDGVEKSATRAAGAA
jgi:hypothetical protein